MSINGFDVDHVADLPEEEPPDFYGEGGSWAKCATCGLTFASVTGFDDHRTGSHALDTRHCRTESEIRARGYAPNENGYWRQPLDESLDHWRK